MPVSPGATPESRILRWLQIMVSSPRPFCGGASVLLLLLAAPVLLSTAERVGLPSSGSPVLERLSPVKRARAASPVSFSRAYAGKGADVLALRGGAAPDKGAMEAQLKNVERNARVAKMYGLLAVQFLSSTAALAYLPHAPKTLTQYLEGRDALLRVGGGSALGLIVSLVLLGSGASIFTCLPLNAVLLLVLSGAKTVLMLATSVFYKGSKAPLIAAGQAVGWAAVLSLAASSGYVDGGVPFVLAGLVSLLPARVISLALGVPIRQAMIGGVVSFILSLIFVYAAQETPSDEYHSGCGIVNASAGLWVDASRFLFRVVWGARGKGKQRR